MLIMQEVIILLQLSNPVTYTWNGGATPSGWSLGQQPANWTPATSAAGLQQMGMQ